MSGDPPAGSDRNSEGYFRRFHPLRKVFMCDFLRCRVGFGVGFCQREAQKDVIFGKQKSLENGLKSRLSTQKAADRI